MLALNDDEGAIHKSRVGLVIKIAFIILLNQNNPYLGTQLKTQTYLIKTQDSEDQLVTQLRLRVRDESD